MAPLLKFCNNLEYFGFRKDNDAHDFYFHLIYNVEIRHFAVKVDKRSYYDDTDTVDVLLLLHKIEALELPSTGITDLTLLELAEQTCMLRQLDVSDCKYISDAGLNEVIRNCPLLQHLNVQNTPTMKTTMGCILGHDQLCYLNALQTLLTKEDAINIQLYFSICERPYKFLYDTSQRTEHETKPSVPVEPQRKNDLRPSREEFDDIFEANLFDPVYNVGGNDNVDASASMTEQDFDDIFNPELFDPEHSVSLATSRNKYSSGNYEIELTVKQYLHRLKAMANKPVLISSLKPKIRIVKNWEPHDWGSDDDGDSSGCNRNTSGDTNSTTDSDSYENYYVKDPEKRRINNDGLKQLQIALDNIEQIKKEYKQLVGDFDVQRPRKRQRKYRRKGCPGNSSSQKIDGRCIIF